MSSGFYRGLDVSDYRYIGRVTLNRNCVKRVAENAIEQAVAEGITRHIERRGFVDERSYHQVENAAVIANED